MRVRVSSNLIFCFLLLVFSTVFLVVNIRMNVFRYNNFDFGKFDLGNMTQMVWNTLNGRFMYLTDYFGTNLPRWSMSHVDPVLVFLVPFFAVFPHPLTLVFVQLIAISYSSLLVYLIARLYLQSNIAAFLLGLSFLFYPAIGFLTSWTGFHGVTMVIPFFLGAFYVFERNYLSERSFTKKDLLVFWVLIVLLLSGKEQISLYVFLYGIFICLFRSGASLTTQKYLASANFRLGLVAAFVGVFWFVMCFFVIIPGFANYRIEGFAKFARSLDLDPVEIDNATSSNYFLKRYEKFGDSYSEIVANILLRPDFTINVFFGGDKVDNFMRTFMPVGFLPFLYPAIFVIAIPDLLINYLTTAGGIGTAEIYNHRISMIIPILFVASIYAIGYLSKLLSRIVVLLAKKNIRAESFAQVLALLLLVLNVKTTFDYENPVYLWLSQALQKRLITMGIAFAKVDEKAAQTNFKLGEISKLTPLEGKDRECAKKVVDMMPSTASISGPDYMGAHLAMRETYAIFPALYTEADFVIVDVFSKKILSILDVDITLVRDVVGDLVKNPDYDLVFGCGNLFVFKKTGPHGKSDLLPLQEKFDYVEKVDYPIFQGLTIVDYWFPSQMEKGKKYNPQVVYTRRNSNSLNEYVLFTTFVNASTGEIHQMANLPSYGLQQIPNWTIGHYYRETLDISMPDYLNTGMYKVFVGIDNNIRTRSVYLGDLDVR